MNAVSTPAKTGASDPGSSRSPTATSAPPARTCSALAGECTSARTLAWRAMVSRRTRLPNMPVAPVIRIISLSSPWRISFSLVSRPASRLGARHGVQEIVVGGLVLAAVTRLPKALGASIVRKQDLHNEPHTLLLFASSEAGVVAMLSVVVTGQPRVARFHESRARGAGLRRPNPETRKVREQVCDPSRSPGALCSASAPQRPAPSSR